LDGRTGRFPSDWRKLPNFNPRRPGEGLRGCGSSRKPSSVPHAFTWRMVICLGWPSPATSSSLPAAHRCRCGRCGSHLAAYLALLRLGVTVPLAVTRSAVGSYPTVSPLPHLREAVSFLWPCPSPLGAQALPGSLPVGARTFLGRTKALPRPPRSARGGTIRGDHAAR
jgi:hypothetical protein